MTLASNSEPLSERAPGRRGTVLFVQFTNPGGYPPLEHAAHLIADAGWRVKFLGVAYKSGASMALADDPRIEVATVRGSNEGWRVKLLYADFIRATIALAVRTRPAWIYASDPLACSPALAARAVSGARVIYHEHDSPSDDMSSSVADRICTTARKRLARSADIAILPQRERLELFERRTGRQLPTDCVWNCPSLSEVASPKRRVEGPLTLYYHGSLNAHRLPFTVLEAMSKASATAELVVVGYETIGSRGYIAELQRCASSLGIAQRVRYLGELPQRLDCLTAADSADIGLALMPVRSDDINVQHMVGASNKPFDYLARGLALVVSDLPAWRSTYVDTGYGRAVEPGSVAALGDLIRWCESHREAVRDMGERGRQQIQARWNYERQFAPVLQRMVALDQRRPA